MFHEISDKIFSRMRYLEEYEEKNRLKGIERRFGLRQIPPETGKFISLIASLCPPGEYIEIGTSAGYSAMWLSLAVGERNLKLKTFEILSEKIKFAHETFHESGIEDCVELIEGDFLEKGKNLQNVAFCFLDAEKDIYEKCFDMLADKIVKNGVIIADNALSHKEAVKSMTEKALNDKRFDCVTIPIGSGEFLCKRK